jgi:hypothetical protein
VLTTGQARDLLDAHPPHGGWVVPPEEYALLAMRYGRHSSCRRTVLDMTHVDTFPEYSGTGVRIGRKYLFHPDSGHKTAKKVMHLQATRIVSGLAPIMRQFPCGCNTSSVCGEHAVLRRDASGALMLRMTQEVPPFGLSHPLRRKDD